MIRRFRVFARQQRFVLVVGLLAAGFVAAGRIELTAIPSVVDERVLLVLFALLVAVELIRQSGILGRIVSSSVSRFHRPRTFVMALVILTGSLSAVITNDVALFIVIPMTMIAGTMIRFSVENAVALEVIAANLLGALTPLGNPQNLYVYYLTGWTPVTFMAVMLPFVLAALAGLSIAVIVTEPGGTISVVLPEEGATNPFRGTLGLAILLLVLGEIAHAVPPVVPATAAAVASVSLLRSRITDMGLSIIPLFFFAFLIVAGLRSFDLYELFALSGSSAGATFAMIVVASQIVSNVPATVLFAPVVDQQWPLLLYAANAGGCGTIIASLANLLGWRIWVREGGESASFLRRLLLLNTAFLVCIGPVSWLLLRLI